MRQKTWDHVILKSCQLVIMSSHHCDLVSMSSCHLVILSSCHLVILSSCHPAILSYCHIVILSSCYPIPISSCQSDSVTICHHVNLLACQLVSFSACASWSLQACFYGYPNHEWLTFWCTSFLELLVTLKIEYVELHEILRQNDYRATARVTWSMILQSMWFKYIYNNLLRNQQVRLYKRSNGKILHSCRGCV